MNGQEKAGQGKSRYKHETKSPWLYCPTSILSNPAKNKSRLRYLIAIQSLPFIYQKEKHACSYFWYFVPWGLVWKISSFCWCIPASLTTELDASLFLCCNLIIHPCSRFLCHWVALDFPLSYSFLQAGSPNLFHFYPQRAGSFIIASMSPFAAVFQVSGGDRWAGSSGQVRSIYRFIQ